MKTFKLQKNEALCLIDAFNGIGYSEGIPRKEHLMGNIAYCVREDHHGKRHKVGEDFLSKINELSEADADALLTQIHKFWGNDRNGMPIEGQPYTIENTKDRLREVGLIE